MNIQVAKLIEHLASLIADLQTDMNRCKTKEAKEAILKIINKNVTAIKEFKQCL